MLLVEFDQGYHDTRSVSSKEKACYTGFVRMNPGKNALFASSITRNRSAHAHVHSNLTRRQCPSISMYSPDQIMDVIPYRFVKPRPSIPGPSTFIQFHKPSRSPSSLTLCHARCYYRACRCLHPIPIPDTPLLKWLGENLQPLRIHRYRSHIQSQSSEKTV